MQTKTYSANSIPAALEMARKEMGENALLVGSKPAAPQNRQFGPLEVTFAWDPTRAEARPSPIENRRMEPVPTSSPLSPAPAETEGAEQCGSHALRRERLVDLD